MLPLFDTVRVERDQAMTQVAQHAEDHRPSFAEDAMAFVLRYLREHGPTAGEVLTEQCKGSGIKAHDDRAMGPVFMVLARRGQIERSARCLGGRVAGRVAGTSGR